MNLFEVRLEIPIDAVERANDVLLEGQLDTWSVFEDVIERRAWVVGLFASNAEAFAQAAALRPVLPTPTVAETVRELTDADWRDSYKRHFHAWQFGRLHWVPVWERETFRLPAGDVVLWLDPGLAFGTGNHETTRLCVERLVTIAGRWGADGGVVDVGCGSGILALSAAKLGFRNVVGFDNDAEAVRVSGENAVFNKLDRQVSFTTADIPAGLAHVSAGLVLANILADVLIRHADDLVRAVAPGGRLVLSGILAAEIETVRRRYTELVPGWAQESRTLGDWSDLVLARPV